MDTQTIARFKELVKAGVIKETLRGQASMNILWKPVNGHIFWRDLVSCRGWVIQQRIGPIYGPYDHYRIPGPDGVRYAFGNSEFLSKRVMEVSINKLTEISTAVREQLSGKGAVAASADKQVYAEFRRLVDSGEIIERLTYQTSTNAEWETLGGEVFWDDLCSRKGWRIQQNKIFKNCRVISPDNTRYTWGCKSYLFRRIMGQPINYVTGYLNNPETAEEHFMNYPALKSSRGVVVLIHGWGCQAKNMEWLARGLNALGYDALCYDYRSSRMSIPDLAKELLDSLAVLVKKGRKKKLFLLTHSMGGLLVRKMLELDRDDRVSSAISRIVMLGPPNQGSGMADAATCCGVSLVNKSIKDMRLHPDAEVHKIGRPAHYSGKIGIIAGKSDFKVLPQKSVEIPGMINGVDYEIVKVKASHAGLKSSYAVLSNAIYFFQHGSFPEQDRNGVK